MGIGAIISAQINLIGICFDQLFAIFSTIIGNNRNTHKLFKYEYSRCGCHEVELSDCFYCNLY